MFGRWAVGLVVAGAVPLWAAEPVEFFEKRVRPVLVKNCYACHSKAVARPMGNVRVDTGEGIGRVVAKGDPEASALYRALTYAHAVKMPPSGKLPGDQIADVAAWIKMGAAYPEAASAGTARHWSFQPVANPPVPKVGNQAWVQSPVDAFILQKLEQAQLAPAGRADKRTLLRRVTFDLTGLPPTPAEVRAFLEDSSPGAFANVVDRLLASPHYGERWGRHWLDVAGFAESSMFIGDIPRQGFWRYRDYVIRAFNEDKPYDRLIVEQLAGDELFNWRDAENFSDEQINLLAATGFLRCTADATDNQAITQMDQVTQQNAAL
ncbi:MAG TPA: hypothetical protein DEH78_26750, partial [Solibacterales bacterium]|nr:hypothetical protein [Bryobacterales bacterium]